MATDLTGLKVKDTYNSLLKIGDNSSLSATPDKISDGLGNESILYLSTSQVSIGTLPATGYDLTVNSAIKTGSIDIVGAATAATLRLTGGSGSQGTLSWNTDEETVDIIQNGATLQVGQEVQVHVKNQTGSTITDGTPVYVTGTLGASGRLTVAPMIADGSIEAKYFLGVTTEDIPNGEDGKVTTFGKIRGLDTTAYSEGQTLYVSASTAGAFQTTAPVAPNLDLEVAIVINSHANNGTIFVRANQGLYLGMLHDVYLSSLANNQFLVYNSTTSRWENQGIASVGSINLDSVTDNGNITTNDITVGDISAGNMTLSGYLRGAGNFVIDPAAYGDETGVVQILGDLRVDGTTTTINSTTVTINDKNIVLASGSATAADANGAGITIDGAAATMLYNSTSDRFVFNKDIQTNLVGNVTGNVTGNLTGDVTGNVTGNLTGNADTASALETARNIAVDGAVTGNADFDGSGDITITTTVNHNHDADYVNVTGDIMTGNLKFNDSVKAQFGSDNDFVVQHNGTHAYLDNNTGSIFIRTYADDSDIVLGSDDGSGGIDDYLRIDGSEGSVILYHYGDQKLTTTSTGISVTGALSGNISTSSISGGTIDINGTTRINLQYNGTTQAYVDSTGFNISGGLALTGVDGISLTDEDSTTDSYFHANVDYTALYTVTSNARYGADYIQVDGLDSRSNTRFTISPKDISSPDPHAYLYIGGNNSNTAPNTLVDWHTIYMNALSVRINNNEVATQSWVTNNFPKTLQQVTDYGNTTTNSISIGKSSAPASGVRLDVESSQGGAHMFRLTNTNSSTNGYAEMQIHNDVGDRLVMGSIGSGYSGAAEWENSSYIYDVGQDALRIKASSQLELFSGGTALANRRVIINSAGNISATGALTVGGTITSNGSLVYTVAGGTVGGTITAAGGINMNNTNITGVNNIVINDAGAGEGIEWAGGNLWKIYESPNTLTNASGNLQFVTNATRRMTLDTSGNLEVTGRVDAKKKSKGEYALHLRGGFYGAPRLQLYDLSVDANAFTGLGVDMSGGAYEMNAYFPRYNGNGRFSIGSWAGDFGTGQYVSGYNEKLFITESASQINVPLTISGNLYASPDGTFDSTPNGTTFTHTLAAASSGGRVVNFDGNGERASVWWTNGNDVQGAIDGLNGTNGLAFWVNSTSGSWQRNFYIDTDYTEFDRRVQFDDRVNISGNVGIGLTTAPIGKLYINTGLTGSSVDIVNQASGTISFANGSGGTAVPNIVGKSANNVGLILGSAVPDVPAAAIDMIFNVVSTTNTDFTTLTSTAFRFSRAGNSILEIKRNGSVGIGTTSPSQKLDVNGIAKANNFVSLVNNNRSGVGFRDWLLVGTYDRAGAIEFGDIAGAKYGIWGGGFDLTFGKHISTTDTYTNVMQFLASNATDSSVDVVFSSGGNVGIGTTAPQRKLHVTKTALGTKYIDNFSVAVIEDTEARLQLCATNGGSNAASVILSNESHHWTMHHRAGSAGNYLAFGYVNTTSTSDIVGNSMSGIGLTVSTNGNVGVGGVTTAAEKLEVDGRIRTNGGEVLVNTSVTGLGWVTVRPSENTYSQYALSVINNTGSAIFATIRGDGTYVGQYSLMGNATTSGDGRYFYDSFNDASSAYYHIPKFIAGTNDGSTGGVDEADVGLLVHNINGANNTWAKIALGGREAAGAGNTVSWAGIAAQKISGTSGSWARGNLHFWVKNNATMLSAAYYEYTGEYQGIYKHVLQSGAQIREGLNLMRSLGAKSGISFYNDSYYNWQVYMSPAGQTGSGANGNLTAPSGLGTVTSWALRSRMEGVSTYGWLWETGGSGGGGATASPKMELGAETGTLRVTGDIIAYASDERLKTNVKPIENAVEKVKQISGVTYDWVDNIQSEYNFHPTTMHEAGVLAQEIEKVLPEAVMTAPMNAPYKEKTGIDHDFKTVKYDRIVPLLIEAIKEQQKQIDELKARLDA